MGRHSSRFSVHWPDAFDERAYLRSILEAEPACVTVIARNGSIVDMNAAGLAMIEATSLEEAQSRPIVELVAAPHRHVFVDLHERVMSGESGTIEFELVGLRGSRRWLETRAVPFRDGSGRVTALLGFTRDVTDSRLHETALRESERRYQVLTNVAPVGIFRTDTSGGTTYVNPQWCTLAGISADEAMGHGWLRAVHPDDRARIEKGWEQAGNERTASAADYRLIRPDGSVVTVLGLNVPEWSHDGAFLGYIGTITDVTARERAETMLEVQRGLLEMIASGVPLEETLTALIAFIERELPEIVASILLVDDDGLRVRHGAAPSLPPEYVAAIDKAPIGPRAGSCGTALYRRAPVITEDIRTDPLWDDYRHIALAVGLRACWSTPIVNRDGIALGSFALYFRQARRPVPQHERLIDMATGVAAVAITRHREEAALATSEERFRATFEYAAVGVAHARPDGRFVRVNPTLLAMTGYSAEEILGLTLADMTHPDNRPADVAQYARLLSNELGHYTTETRFLRKDGEPIWVNATLSMVRTPAGAPDYAILIVEDVTARRHLEVQLRQSQRLEAVGLLAGGVAHDFNNVLSVILGLSEAVRDELPAGHALRDDLQEIVDAASRGAAITRQLLTFARKDAGRPVTLDVSQSLEGLHPLLARLLGEHLSLRTLLPPSLGHVRIDPSQFDRVMINLVANAKEAMGSAGTVTIDARDLRLRVGDLPTRPDVAPGDYVVVSVSDSGSGMDASTQERIFTPFFTTKSHGKGTGLGLPVVLGVSQQAGGYVVVESAPGAGTTFRIYLPRCGDAVVPAAKADTREALRGRETILVVEDEPALLNLARRTLEACGYSVLAAGGPREAIDLASAHGQEIELLLTDVVMPDMSGRQLSDRLTQMHPRIKTVYMSGYPAHVLEERGQASLAATATYIQKPFTRAVLAHQVRAALDEHPPVDLPNA